MSRATMGLEPIRRAVTVSWDQPSAFKRFTAQFAQWWPHREMSIGGHSGYEMSWSVIMNVFAEKRTALYWLFWLFSVFMDNTRGRQAFVDNAGGRMSA